jgi:hypothetical protein
MKSLVRATRRSTAERETLMRTMIRLTVEQRLT